MGWKNIPDFVPQNKPVHGKISIIIPARNEEKNIGLLLKAIEKQTCRKEFYEVIVVDDHSTDRTAEIVRGFSAVRLIQLESNNINSYKKKAIEEGISFATGDLIVTTDADCIPHSHWLQTILTFKTENDPAFIAAPVCFTNDNSLLQIFQSLDFLVLQGISGASVHKKIHSMSNGANMAYEKKLFEEVNGFSGIDSIASGDDMLLMGKFLKKHPDKVHYLKSKEAIVTTEPMKTWKEFFNQRIRWASKARYYNDLKIVSVLLLVYLFNLSFPVLLIAGFFNKLFWIYFLILWVAKTIVELPFVFSVAVFFNKQSLLRYFFFFQPLHILYTIVAGLLGQTGKYEWKGRRVK